MQVYLRDSCLMQKVTHSILVLSYVQGKSWHTIRGDLCGISTWPVPSNIFCVSFLNFHIPEVVVPCWSVGPEVPFTNFALWCSEKSLRTLPKPS